jgi:hypothetical protein
VEIKEKGAEEEVQDFSRKLFFDVLILEKFSTLYPELVDFLFQHWKEEIITTLDT